MKRVTSKYKGTKLQEIDVDGTTTHEFEDRLLVSWYVNFPNDQQLSSNLHVLKVLNDQPNLKYFIIDSEDYKWINGIIQKYLNASQHKLPYTDPAFYLRSLENFSSERKKKLYIRVLHSVIVYSVYVTPTRKLFTDEVLELIPIALRQQNSPINNSDARLEKYRKKWESNKKHVFNVIDISVFEELLEEFDINKEEVTLVPDFVKDITEQNVKKKPEDSIRTIGPDASFVMEPTKSAFHTFKSIVFGYNWKIKCCEKHSKCIEHIENDLSAILEDYERMKWDVFVKVDYVEDRIEHLKKSLCVSPDDEKYKQLWTRVLAKSFEVDVPLQDYHSYCGLFGLSIYQNVIPNAVEDHIPAWMIWIFLMTGWVQCFPILPNIKGFLLEPLVHRPPVGFLHPKELQLFLANIVFKEVHDEIFGSEAAKDYDKLLKSGEKRREKLRQQKNAKKNYGQTPATSSNTENKTTIVVESANEFVESLWKDYVFGNTNEQQNTAELSDVEKYKQNIGEEIKQMLFNSRTEKPPVTYEHFESLHQEMMKQSAESSSTKATTNKIPEETETRIEKLEEEKNNELKTTNSREEPKKTNSLEKESQITLNESKSCSKCLRTSEICNEAQKELKKTQNKLKTFEKKSTRYNELEKKMNEMRKKMKEKDDELRQLKNVNSESDKELKRQVQEMEKMKSRFALYESTEAKLKETNKKQVQVTEKMNSRLAQYESTEAKLKETNEKVTESRDHLQEKVAHLEAQLKSKEQNSQVSQLEREILEKDKTIALLEETNMRVTVRNEEQAKNIQNLLDRLTKTNSNRT